VSGWTDPVWRAEADEWIHAQLARLGSRAAGPIDQHHVYPWSTVMRVPTGTGDVFFKANIPALRYEAALVEVLAERRPDCIPPLLAVDLERGWMLMADAGTSLRELIARERELTRWLEILPLYAGVQIDLVDEADRLVALGVPDLRLARLPAMYEQLLGDLAALPTDDRRRLDESLPLVGELCRELAAYGVAETIQHDDFHDGQVYVSDGRYLLLDWGDSCVSHPFFTMSVTLEGNIAWGVDDVQGSVEIGPFRDAYAEPFVRLAGDADLDAAFTIAIQLGWVCRAVNGHLGGTELAHTWRRLSMFLDGRA
jgi:hypothetical protein